MPEKKPNLFVIGAMKSGTTSLHRYLGAHPEIFMSEEKEPGYFAKGVGWERGEDWYLSLFADASSERYLGESSTHYTKLPTLAGAPERIAAFNPDARFIYVMRHPFQRLVSHYWHEVRQLQSGGEMQGIDRACLNNPDYLAFSHYAMQLQPYIDIFGAERIHLVTFEELTLNPKEQLLAIFDWLQVSREFDWEVLAQRHNALPDTIIGASGRGWLNQLRYSSAWNRIAGYIPKSLRKVASQAAQKEIDPDAQQQAMRSLEARLAPQFQEQIAELSTLTGRDFSAIWCKS